ncbi:MAG TPA: zinc-binding alcohol dehydrogenase family protein [Sphingobium sp.]|uniref:zinc-binding alcohol dehydrogenase family protein n=1 Tax=Sphingobium sp. TaxID=1912891 RepID=UPI002ED61110
MRAIVYKEPGPIDRPNVLLDVDLPEPTATGRDILVEVKAVSVNPVDTKVRNGAPTLNGERRTLGYDAAGVVKAVGPDVTLFQPGDDVFYAGSIVREGTNSQFHLVDERIVAAKPKSLDWAQSAALPLTAITAWETLFERLNIRKPVPWAANAILIIGGAGGVGSLAVQFARLLTDVTVIATASRPETQSWAAEMGAHHVIDHSKPLAEQIEALGLGAPAFVFSTTHTDRHFPAIVELIAPQGRFAMIDDFETFDVVPLKAKSVSLHWEMMFTRSLFETADMDEQGKLLAEVAQLVDSGQVKTTVTNVLKPISAATLTSAHAMIESNSTRGKVVLEGWE